LVIVAGIVNPW